MGIEPLDALVIWRWFRAESLASRGRPRCPHGRSPHIRESVPAVRPHADDQNTTRTADPCKERRFRSPCQTHSLASNRPFVRGGVDELVQ
jgi:hypothetical protein